MVKGYGLFNVTGDRYGWAWPVEAYSKQGISYFLAEKTAIEFYLGALPLFTGHQIELPDNDRLKNQLLSLMRRTNPGGRDSVVAGQSDGSHADLANAVAGAVWLAAGSGCQDQQPVWVAKGRCSADGPIAGDGFADFFFPQQSADDWLHDR